MMSESKFIYLAGLLDGEGTVGVYNESNGKNNPRRTRVRMIISNTSLDLMNYLKTNFNLKYIQITNYESHKGKKIMYRAVFNEHQIRDYGPKMLPYLVIKHDKLEMALKCIMLKQLRGHGKWQ